MDNELLISQIAERAGPTVTRVDRLVSSLRVCSIFATGRTASRLSLTSPDGEPLLFASSLTSISNRGLDTLADVVKFLHELRKTAESLAAPEGTLESLRKSFGNPAERQNHERLRSRLEKQAQKCRASGQELETKLHKWKLEIEDFRTAVHATRGPMEAEMEEYDAQIGKLDYEKKLQEDSLNDTREQEADAQTRYQAAQSEQKSIIDSIQIPRTFTLGDTSLSVVRFGWSRFQSYKASGDIKHYQEETDRMRRAAEEYETNLSEAQVSLQNLSGKSAKLQDFTNALALTLKALESFADNVRVLSSEFSNMDSDVKQLLDTHAETNEMSTRAAADNGTPLSEIKGFSDNVYSMSKKAVIVENLAWLYADVIQGVMMGGLEDLTSGHGSSAEHQRLDRAITESGHGQQLQLVTSDTSSTSKAISTKVDLVGQIKMDGLNERYRVFAEKMDAREKAEAKAEKKKTRNFFGRKRT